MIVSRGLHDHVTTVTLIDLTDVADDDDVSIAHATDDPTPITWLVLTLQSTLSTFKKTLLFVMSEKTSYCV